jgi:hypothetical protein
MPPGRRRFCPTDPAEQTGQNEAGMNRESSPCAVVPAMTGITAHKVSMTRAGAIAAVLDGELPSDDRACPMGIG